MNYSIGTVRKTVKGYDVWSDEGWITVNRATFPESIKEIGTIQEVVKEVGSILIATDRGVFRSHKEIVLEELEKQW